MESPPVSSENKPDDPTFWQIRYDSQSTPWDLGEVAPPFSYWLHHQNRWLTPGMTMAVIGCGKGHDAAFFARAGFHVTGLDFAPGAIAAAQSQYGDLCQWVQADLFDLPPGLHHQFDVVLEHTCYCAIPPKRREDYVRAIKTLLKPQGFLLALFFMHGEWGGPPYSTNPQDLAVHFGSPFKPLFQGVPEQSIEARKHKECLVLFQLS